MSNSLSSSPIALGLKGFSKAGLTMTNPTTFQNADTLINLYSDSPQQVKDTLHGMVLSNMLDDYVNDQLKDSNHSHDRDILNHGLWVHPIKQLFYSKARGSLSPRQARLMLLFVTGQIVDGMRLKKWGYRTLGKCPFCGQDDTTWHRVYVCPHFHTQRLEIFKPRILQAAIKAGPHSVLFSRAWSPNPAHILKYTCPVTHSFDFKYFIDGVEQHSPFFLDDGVEVHGDGSALRPCCPITARAGFAVAQTDGQGKVTKMITAALPSQFPQTAAVAERVSIVAANNHLPGHQPTGYVGDCKGALKLITHHVLSRSPALPWAGLAREIYSRGIAFGSARWVKAHQCIDDGGRSSEAQNDVHANAAVDTGAKAAAASQHIPEADLSAIGKQRALVKAIAASAAKMLELWPKNLDLYGKLDRVPGTGGPTGRKRDPNAIPHRFTWRGKHWACEGCLRKMHKVSRSVCLSPCTGLPQPIREILAEPRGHKMMTTSDDSGLPIFFCVECGHHATVLPRHLLKLCNGKDIGSYARKCFLSNPPIHPRSRVKLSPPVPADFTHPQAGLWQKVSVPATTVPPVSTTVASFFDEPDHHWHNDIEESFEESEGGPFDPFEWMV